MDGFQGVEEPNELLDAFQTNYHHFEQLVREAVTHATDSTILARLGDELDEYLNLVNEVSSEIIFKNNILITSTELNTIHTNLGIMQTDMHMQYQDVLDVSHHGQPAIVETIHMGNCGHRCVSIDPVFLCWAYSQRTVSGIAYFLGVHMNMV